MAPAGFEPASPFGHGHLKSARRQLRHEAKMPQAGVELATLSGLVSKTSAFANFTTVAQFPYL